MKISQDRPAGLAGGAEPLAGVTAPVAGAPQKAPSRAGDQLTLSPEARFLRDTVKAASRESDVRPEVVARMRALVAGGGVGRDAGALADAIIDSWLHSR